MKIRESWLPNSMSCLLCRTTFRELRFIYLMWEWNLSVLEFWVLIGFFTIFFVFYLLTMNFLQILFGTRNINNQSGSPTLSSLDHLNPIIIIYFMGNYSLPIWTELSVLISSWAYFRDKMTCNSSFDKDS